MSSSLDRQGASNPVSTTVEINYELWPRSYKVFNCWSTKVEILHELWSATYERDLNQSTKVEIYHELWTYKSYLSTYYIYNSRNLSWALNLRKIIIMAFIYNSRNLSWALNTFSNIWTKLHLKSAKFKTESVKMIAKLAQIFIFVATN